MTHWHRQDTHLATRVAVVSTNHKLVHETENDKQNTVVCRDLAILMIIVITSKHTTHVHQLMEYSSLRYSPMRKQASVVDCKC
jgi:hypothetical protein